MVRRSSLAAVALVFALGCTTVTYPGPRRPANEIAVLVNRDTAIDGLDDQFIDHRFSQRGARYEVLPGRHKLRVSLFVVVPHQDFTDVERSPNQIDVCFDFQAGHKYAVGREGAGFAWRPLIVDETTQQILPAPGC